MPKVGRTFVAKGGTEFTWYPDDPKTTVELRLPSYGTPGAPGGLGMIKIPGADLDEFIAHILRRGVDDTCETLLFPSLRAPTPKGAA